MKKLSGFHWWMLALLLVLIAGIGVTLWGILWGDAIPLRDSVNAAAFMIRRLSIG